MIPLLEVEKASVSYLTKNQTTCAVQEVSFSIYPGEIIGVVGESGSGKSSLFQSIFRLISDKKALVTQKKCFFEEQEISSFSDKAFRKKVYRKIGWVPQDPFLSLHPNKKVKKQLLEALLYHSILPYPKALARIDSLLLEMGVPLENKEKYPHELSGGLRQRVLLVMALSTYPLLLIADEPSSSLDVILQRQLLSLFKKIHKNFSTTLVLISHDIGFLSKICTQIFVMYAGKIVEKQKTSSIFKNPLHPYTEALIKTNLSFQTKELIPILGNLPSLKKPFTYCSFVERCPYKMDICQKKSPPFFPHQKKGAACWKNEPLTKEIL